MGYTAAVPWLVDDLRCNALFSWPAIIRQDVGWFDEEENSTGALTARLATEATLIKNITGQNLGR